MKLSPLERLTFWWTCRGFCHCPHCCIICRAAYLELNLTEGYANEKLERLRAFARRALRWIRAMLVLGFVLGAIGLVQPAMMSRPNPIGCVLMMGLSAVCFVMFMDLDTKERS